MAVLLGTASAQVTLDISQFMANARTAEGAMNELASAGTGAGTRGPNFLDRLGTSALALGTALVVPMGIGLKAAVDLEQAIANVDAALGDVADSTLSRLTAGFQEMAAASQFSATEVAAIGEGLAKAGFDDTELLNVTQAVIDLSQATGDGLAPAMDSVIASMSIWSDEIVDADIALTDASRVADIMTTAANNSSASIGDINAGMRSLGPVAAGLGISFEEAAAAIALMTNYGLKGADAGVSLSRALTNLANPAAGLDDQLATLGLSMDQLGIDAFDLEGNFVGFPALFNQLNTGMASLDDETKAAALSMIFGAEAADVMAIAIETGADPLQALIDLMGESGTAAEQSAIRMDTLGAQFGTLKEGINTFLGSLVSGLIPGLRIFVDMANQVIDVLMRIPAPIKTIIGTIAGLLAGFASIAAAVRTFQALNLLLGGMGLASGGLAASLGAVLTPLLLIGAAVGALYLAWRTNFLGMQGIVTRFTSGLRRFGRSFTDTFRNLTTATYQWGDTVEDIVPTMARFPAFFIALGNALGTVGGGLPILGDLGRGIIDFGFRMETLLDVFGRLTDEGFNPFIAGLTAITSAFPELIPIVNAVTPVVESLVEAFQRFRDGDFSGAIASLGDALAAAVSGIAAAIGALNIGEVLVSIGSWAFTTAVELATDLYEWVTGTAIPAATGVMGTLADVAVEIASWALERFVSIASYVSQWADEAIAAVTGTAAVISDVAVEIGSWLLARFVSMGSYVALWTQQAWAMASGAPQQIADVAVSITSWAAGTIAPIGEFLAEQIDGMSFSEVGATIVSKIGDALVGAFKLGEKLGGSFDDLIIGLFDGLTAAIEGIDWENVGSRTAQLMTAGMIGALSAPAALVSFGISLGAGVLSALGEADWPGIGTAILGFLQAAISGLKDFAVGFGSTLGSEFKQAVGQVDWPGVATSIKNGLVGAISGLAGFAVSLGATLGSEVIQAVANVNWSSVASSLKDRLLSAISGLTGFAVGLGKTLGDELTQALANVNWSGIGSSIKDYIVSNIKGVGQAIWDAIWAEFESLNGAGDQDNPLNIPNPSNDPEGEAGGRGFAPKRLIDPAAIADVERFRSALEGLNSVAASVGPAFDGLNASVSGSMNALIATMTNSAATAVTATEAIFATLGTSIAASMTGVAAAVQGSMNGVIAAMANGGATAVQAMSNALAPLPSIVQSVGSRAASAALVSGLQIAMNFRNGAALAPGLVAAALSGVAGAVSAAGGRAAGAALAAGINIGQAMAAGIRSQIGNVAAAAAALGAAATVSISSKLLIRSPSKVFMQLGEYVSEGFALGIRSGIPLAASAASDLAYVPNVRPGQYANNPYQTNASGSVTYAVNVTVEGNVTTEDALIANATQRIGAAIVDDLARHQTASGVVQ